MKKIEKILAIHYYYYPINAIGTRRNMNVLNHLSDLLSPVETMVISTKNSYIKKDYTLKLKHKAIYVHTLDMFAWAHLKHSVLKKKKRIDTKTEIKNILPNTPSTSRFLKFQNTLIGNFILGEGGWLYILSAFFRARKFVNKNTIILSSFSPLSDHIIAYLLKLFNPKAIWIADFRDLYIQENINNIYGFKIHKYILQKMLKRADIVSTVSEGLAVRLEQFSKKVVVLRNGINLNKVPKNNNKLFSNKFVLSYTGSLYGLSRDPSPILTAISNAVSTNKIAREKIVINYAGTDAVIWDSLINKFELQNLSRNYGVIDREKALELQQASSINIAITWCDKNNRGILTGKFFEYIEAGNLILLLIKGERDAEFEQIINNTNVGSYFYDSEIPQIENWIVEKYNQWVNKNYINVNYNLDALKKLTWKSQIQNALIKPLNIARPINDHSLVD